MKKEQLANLFTKRLHAELMLFQAAMLRKEKEEIYAEAYKIEAYASLYEILIEQAGRMTKKLLDKLVYLQYGILETFYQGWLKWEDSSYVEMKEYVEDEIKVRSQREETDERKEQ